MNLSWIKIISDCDAELSFFVQRTFSSYYLDLFFSSITDLHKQTWFQFSIILPLLFVWLWRERKVGLIKFSGLLLTLILIDSFCGLFIKKVFARPRPFVLYTEILQKSPASGFSFVSNHAANMVGLAAFLSHYYPRWRYFWWTIAILIGFSRFYNGVHFLTDVIAGGLMGWVISRFTVHWIDRRLKMEYL